MKNLETLREIIIKEVPSILDLEFGCEFQEKDEADNLYKKYTVVGHIFKEHDSDVYDILAVDSKPENQAFAEEYINAECRIIGRKITLADVLVALWKNVKFIEIAHDGQFRIEDKSYYKGSYLPQWKLVSDDLNYQSQECIDFLLNLLS